MYLGGELVLSWLLCLTNFLPEWLLVTCDLVTLSSSFIRVSCDAPRDGRDSCGVWQCSACTSHQSPASHMQQEVLDDGIEQHPRVYSLKHRLGAHPQACCNSVGLKQAVFCLCMPVLFDMMVGCLGDRRCWSADCCCRPPHKHSVFSCSTLMTCICRL